MARVLFAAGELGVDFFDASERLEEFDNLNDLDKVLRMVHSRCHRVGCLPRFVFCSPKVFLGRLRKINQVHSAAPAQLPLRGFRSGLLVISFEQTVSNLMNALSPSVFCYVAHQADDDSCCSLIYLNRYDLFEFYLLCVLRFCTFR